jgi:hypothetical protein
VIIQPIAQLRATIRAQTGAAHHATEQQVLCSPDAGTSDKPMEQQRDTQRAAHQRGTDTNGAPGRNIISRCGNKLYQ